MWKPLFSDRNDHSNHMETAQRSKSQRPLNLFGSDSSDCSDHIRKLAFIVNVCLKTEKGLHNPCEAYSYMYCQY